MSTCRTGRRYREGWGGGWGVFIYARVCAYTSKFEHERVCVFACVP